MMEILAITILFGCFLLLLFLGVPICFAIGIATLLSVMTMLPFETSLILIAQRLSTGLKSFSLLAIPFFILAGVLMNQGGIARRLINFSQVLVGTLPGSLAHVNIMANMLFGSISGSGAASAAAVGSIISPVQKKEGYNPAFSAAVNAASCPVGLLIPPSNVMIVYALTSGSVSIAALFMAGYLPGILMGLCLMAVTAWIAAGRHYPRNKRPPVQTIFRAFLEAMPCLSLIIIVMGGILSGIFTATEASAFAVAYSFILAFFIYREITIKQLPSIILESVITTSIVLLLVAVSVSMSWALTSADLPNLISTHLLKLSDNPILIILAINLLLLFIGTFMDMTPAVLVFTPIFLPIATELGMSPLHFGIMMIFNLCIGLITPPVGNALFIGCSVGKVDIHQVIRPMLPFYVVLFLLLMIISFVPQISLFLPHLFGLN
ncbi:TRAP transporter large permease [Endozoicomonas numazuensis]|uniref:TRAP transporter large permease protein n=1 Tax=Endozoicomonas numazuensis TaxID=1137799 RepID=A0A081N6A3_9GAMM|nr:TRAP transporter large permease [Endozoicomonas numazuensis]KEQ13976.1 membrane protein [Endozoicomonas numazuensis]